MSGTWPVGVVTSVWGPYGQFLPEWVESVAAQTVRPQQVTIVDAGIDNARPLRSALRSSGLPWQIIKTPYKGMGAARNRAVEATPCEWVIHLDADDTLLPHALADVKALAPWADVVSVGMMRGQREVLFPRVSAQEALEGRHVAFSCAAFRRSLWERAPWHTSNDWIDSTLWVGFARLGARFAGTERAGAVYRQHPGSFSRRLTPVEKRLAKAQLRRMVSNPRWKP